ncbi:MAG TPA: 3-dehydroquinate synthase, partial [Thiothrix sp.]|nr:3-dehydroquinate synthase [Thiothrix sp.]
TFGHAIETGMGYGKWLHGEAVAAGMVMAARLSEKMGWLAQSEVDMLASLLESANLPTQPPKDMTAEQFIAGMAVDKKVMDGVLRLVLMKSWGESVVTADYDKVALQAVLAGD